MDQTEELIKKLQNLSIEQQQLVNELIDELSNKSKNKSPPKVSSINSNLAISKSALRTSSNGVLLKIGDKVRILNNRKTGKVGDLATVLKFNKKYIALQLDRNGSHTQRDPKHLEFVVSR